MSAAPLKISKVVLPLQCKKEDYDQQGRAPFKERIQQRALVRHLQNTLIIHYFKFIIKRLPLI